MRVAFMPEVRFGFEVTIDPDATHKRAHEGPQKRDMLRELRRCLDQGRVVVAFRNARALTTATSHNGPRSVLVHRGLKGPLC